MATAGAAPYARTMSYASSRSRRMWLRNAGLAARFPERCCSSGRTAGIVRRSTRPCGTRCRIANKRACVRGRGRLPSAASRRAVNAPRNALADCFLSDMRAMVAGTWQPSPLVVPEILWDGVAGALEAGRDRHAPCPSPAAVLYGVIAMAQRPAIKFDGLGAVLVAVRIGVTGPKPYWNGRGTRCAQLRATCAVSACPGLAGVMGFGLGWLAPLPSHRRTGCWHYLARRNRRTGTAAGFVPGGSRRRSRRRCR